MFRLIFRFFDIFGFTCDFNFALAKEVENVINDEDGTFLDSELVNREIVNSVNDKNNDIDNVNSLNIVNNYYIHNFYDSLQIDAWNSNNTDHEASGGNYDSQKDEWLQKQYKRCVSLSVSLFKMKSFNSEEILSIG